MMMMGLKPLCIDLFCGLGGWTEGFLVEGWDCIGFDIERHDYGTGGYPAPLVLQDVRTLNGSQFKDASLIVASPPCQKYSYMSLPWTRAKRLVAEYRSGVRSIEELNELFNASFRIAAEANLPVIIENVRGAQEWVGPAKWNYGSYYLWGDVPALMPYEKYIAKPFNTTVEQRLRDSQKLPGNNAPRMWSDRRIQRLADAQQHPFYNSSLKSSARKAASAHIAKIPLALSQHIARCYKPQPKVLGVSQL